MDRRTDDSVDPMCTEHKIAIARPFEGKRIPIGYRNFLERTHSLYKDISSSQGSLIRYWQKTTEVISSESRFTIIIPVHNEEESLEAVAESLCRSFIPNEVGVYIVFILNGCTDKSEDIITNFLGSIGTVRKRRVSKREFIYYKEPGINSIYFEVSRGNNVWRVYQTKTLGKANALRLGSQMACYMGHRILLSIDANNYIEPSTIALMFRSAHLHFVKHRDGTVILSAPHKSEYKKEPNYLERLLREHGVFDDATYTTIYGCCMAVEPNWVGINIRPVAIEDYAMGVVARVQGAKVRVLKDARVWGYKTDLRDSFNQTRRYIRGIIQLLHLCPELKHVIVSDHYIMRPINSRISAIAAWIKSDPKNILRYLWRFIYGELNLALAKYDYFINPTNQSWKSLSSTK